MAILLLPLNPELYQAQKVKNNNIEQMLDSINTVFQTLRHTGLMVHSESELRHFDYRATPKQTENCLVDPELHSASTWVFSFKSYAVG